MSRYIKWEDCKKNNPEETIKMFRSFNEKDLGPSIKEFFNQYITTMLYLPEDPLPVHIIPDEV